MAELAIKITADDQASKALEGIQGRIQGMSKGLRMAGVGMVAAGGAIMAALGMSIKSFAKAGDEVQKMAMRTGFSTEALSELRYVAELSGASLASLETGTKRMSRVIMDAGEGMASAQRPLERLGLSYEALAGLSPEEQFFKITSALAELEDHTEKSATAQELFGRSGTDLLPMLAMGAEGMEAMRAKAHELGIVFDQEAADKAAGFNDAMTTLGKSIEGVKNMIAEHLIPVLTPLIDKVTEIISKVKDWVKEYPKLFRVITLVVGVVGALLIPLGTFLILLPSLVGGLGMLGVAFTIATGPVGLIIAAIAALIAIGILLWKNWDIICAKAKEIWGAITDFFKEIWNKITSIFKAHWDKILAILFPAIGIPVLIARNWEPIVDFFKKIWQKIEDIFASGINFIINQINKLPFINIPKIGIETPAIPSYQYGGIVPQTGLAYLHRGETVVPANAIITIPIYLDGDLIAERVIDIAGNKARLQGAY